MKLPRIFPARKLRATTARRSPVLGIPEDDYESAAEPNMKLSRALLIVLVLHIVAVAGIIAFNAIKTPQAAADKAPNATPAPVEAKTETAPPAVAATVPASTPATALARLPELKPAPAPPTTPTSPNDSGKTYVVVKGDNPVAIARKLKVPYDELMAVNHITDPHKLQIGQKLVVPATSSAKPAAKPPKKTKG